jgi:ribonuclease P protein component
MLPKKERFTKIDFLGKKSRVFFRGFLFDVAYIKLPTQKFACVISKKTIKKAVNRNSVKRKILNAVQEVKKEEHGLSLVFFPKKGSDTTPYSQIFSEIGKAFDTLKAVPS